METIANELDAKSFKEFLGIILIQSVNYEQFDEFFQLINQVI